MCIPLENIAYTCCDLSFPLPAILLPLFPPLTDTIEERYQLPPRQQSLSI